MINDPKEFSCHACIYLQSINLDSLEKALHFLQQFSKPGGKCDYIVVWTEETEGMYIVFH